MAMLNKPSSRWAYLRGNIGVMLLSSGLWNLAGAMTWPFYSLYVLELGGSHLDIGLISALSAVFKIAPTFIGGYLADSLGRKKMVYTMSLGLAVNQIIMGFAPSYRYLYIAAVIEALLSGLRQPSLIAIVADSTQPENRAFSFALWQVVPPLFGLFSPYVIGIQMDRHGIITAMRWAYLFVFSMALAASLMRYRYLEETLTDEEATGEPAADPRKFIRDFRETFRRLPVQLWVFLLIDFIFTFAWALTEPYFVTYAKEVVGLSAAQWGLTSTLFTVVRTFMLLPAARASDRHGRLKFILATMFLWPVSFIFFVNSVGFYGVLMAQVLMAVFDSIGNPAWDALFVDLSPKEHRGRFNAVANVSWSLIWGAGNITGGAIYQNQSKKNPFIAGAGLFVIGALLTLLRVKEPEEREE
ncbi:MAG: MFS transporter [Candidatus Bathyarchaeota archaeon]|nr:MAG: MFS transporter [Candidatus Bathyarchaeota archaeon]